MQFSDTTNNLGIIQACERYTNLGDTGISGDSAKLKDFTAYVNTVMRRLWHSIFEASGSWQYDDSNQTDLPQATTDLVSGTATYALPATALTVKRLEAKDSNGEWYVLKPLVIDEIGEAIPEFFDVDGDPSYYRLVGNTIELFAAPSYNSTGGLKVYYDRGSVAFASTDTTKTPGFASEYHDLVPVGASLEWLKIKQPQDATTARLAEDYASQLQQLNKFYNKRFSDKKLTISRQYQTFK